MRTEFTTTAQVVWDTGGSGIAMTPDGETMRLGDTGEWTPDALLALAAASALMQTVLRMASDADIDILGYVSTVRVESAAETSLPCIQLCPCVVISNDEEEALVRELCRRAAEQSPIARLLGTRLLVEPLVQPIWTGPLRAG
jgi:organic hydroperoxide reductase OsmC/OhrA